ncbi:PhzF family phenazine biosynthesis protein [Kitasatospora sp. NPDC093550]|uniref:PhzF family phenazine biosynthesis protein n=1 Tax=Kitasatospora sp. NPDC093550 TaxID=3364089 RepID=UPI0037F8D489
MTPAHAPGAAGLFWCRVFASGTRGGNHTAIVLPGAPTADPAALAAALDVPDTGFVQEASADRVLLRTFSPVEELAQCVQTSLAAVVALGVPEGTAHRVRHLAGEELTVHREGPVVWARPATARPRPEETAWPDIVRADPDPDRPPVVLRQARSRLHLGCADAGQLAALDIAAPDVLALCEATGTNGLVLSAAEDGGRRRVRVFTTSLAGAEDSATGGAVLGLGQIEARHGVRGDLTVVQGPADPARQGHLRLRLAGADEVLLGGEVLPLARGTLELP